MLRDRYEAVDLFKLIPKLGLAMEPWLASLDKLLDDDQVIAAVRADFVRRYKLTASHGRPSTPVEVLLRMLVVMRIYGWSYEQAEYYVKDSLVLRQFCRVYLERVPDDTTLIRWANTLGPERIRANQLNVGWTWTANEDATQQREGRKQGNLEERRIGAVVL